MTKETSAIRHLTWQTNELSTKTYVVISSQYVFRLVRLLAAFYVPWSRTEPGSGSMSFASRRDDRFVARPAATSAARCRRLGWEDRSSFRWDWSPGCRTRGHHSGWNLPMMRKTKTIYTNSEIARYLGCTFPWSRLLPPPSDRRRRHRRSKNPPT